MQCPHLSLPSPINYTPLFLLPFAFPSSPPSLYLFPLPLTLSFLPPPNTHTHTHTHTHTWRSMKSTDPELSPANRMFLYKHKYMIRTPHLNWISSFPFCGKEMSPQLPLKGKFTNLGSPHKASIHLKIYLLWTCKHCLACLMWFKLHIHTHECTYGTNNMMPIDFLISCTWSHSQTPWSHSQTPWSHSQTPPQLFSPIVPEKLRS